MIPWLPPPPLLSLTKYYALTTMGYYTSPKCIKTLRVLVQSIFAPSRCPINLKPCNYCLIVTPLALKLSSLTIFKGAILVSLLLPLLLLLWLCPSYSFQKYLLSPCCMSGTITGTTSKFKKWLCFMRHMNIGLGGGAVNEAPLWTVKLIVQQDPGSPALPKCPRNTPQVCGPIPGL